MVDSQSNVYRTALEGIKAPLGVLLYLIRRDNLDIYNIPIARITREYLEYLDLMEELHIELAGEFFVMAATLMRIKIQMLLRKDESDEDPREGLVRSLLEYKKMLEAAKSLKDMEEQRMNIFHRPVPEREKELVEEPTLELNLYQLMKAFRSIVAEFEERDVSEIEPEVYTMEEKIVAILASLSSRDQISFHELFSDTSSRLEMIVTFMALLELIKLAKVKARQEDAFGSIWIYRAPAFDLETGAPGIGAGEEGAGSVEPNGKEAHDAG